jgi:NAD+ synthase (glutamine-hydrolysing)
VLGTGDLSELALGWCTYGVGDQMSHYNVNASVPKTLIQHLIRWVANSDDASAETPSTCSSTFCDRDFARARAGGADGSEQKTEDFVGPYNLQDFNLFYTTRYGYRPSKIAYLAHHAWSDAEARRLAANIPAEKQARTTSPRSSAGSACF